MGRVKEQPDNIVINGMRFKKLPVTEKINIPELTELATYVPETGPITQYRVVCKPQEKYHGRCVQCGMPGIYSHGYAADRVVHDIGKGNIPVTLQIEVPRYKCPNCGSTFSHPFEFVQPNSQISDRLYDQLGYRLIEEPIAKVEETTGLSLMHLTRILRSIGAELDEAYAPVAPEALGIDGTYIQGIDRLVLVDIFGGTIVEMFPDNGGEQTIKAVRKLENRENIKYICTDLAKWYPSTIQKMKDLGVIDESVLHVADQYHVIQNMQRAVNATRKNLMEAYKKWNAEDTRRSREIIDRENEILRRLAKRPRLLSYSPAKLLTPCSTTAKEESRRANLRLLADVCKELGFFDEVRYYAHFMYAIYQIKDPRLAEKALDCWIKTADDLLYIPEMKPLKDFRDTVVTWRTEILNYFKSDSMVNNSTMEGLNSFIKAVMRSGRGYNFDVIRIKCVYHTKASHRPKIAKGKIGSKGPVKKKVSSPPRKLTESRPLTEEEMDEFVDALRVDSIRDLILKSRQELDP